MTGLLYDTRPNSASTNDWIQASKDMVISAYSEVLPVESAETFTKTDFQQALKKVSRKRETFFGENIKDAWKAIKG